jgi:hypothetical protein
MFIIRGNVVTEVIEIIALERAERHCIERACTCEVLAQDAGQPRFCIHL